MDSHDSSSKGPVVVAVQTDKSTRAETMNVCSNSSGSSSENTSDSIHSGISTASSGSSKSNGSCTFEESQSLRGKTNPSSRSKVVQVPGSDICFQESDVVRLAMQLLQELGHKEAAQAVSHHTGYTLTHVTVRELESHIVEGNWLNAQKAVRQLNSTDTNPLDTGCYDLIAYMLACQQYVEAVAGSCSNAIFDDSAMKPLLDLLQLDVMECFVKVKSRIPSTHYHQLATLLAYKLPSKVFQMADECTHSVLVDKCGMASGRMGSSRQVCDWANTKEKSREHLKDLIMQLLPAEISVPPNRMTKMLNYAVTHQLKDTIFTRSLSREKGVVPLLQDLSTYADENPQKPNKCIQQVSLKSCTAEPVAVWLVELNPKGNVVVFSGNSPQVELWSIEFASGEPYLEFKLSLEHCGVPNSLAWSPSGDSLLSCSDTGIRVVKLLSSTIDSSSNPSLNSTKFGDHLEKTMSSAQFRCAIWVDDGKHFVTGGIDRILRLWEVKGNELRVITCFKVSEIYDMAVSIKHQRLVVAAGQHQLLFYSLSQLWKPVGLASRSFVASGTESSQSDCPIEEEYSPSDGRSSESDSGSNADGFSEVGGSVDSSEGENHDDDSSVQSGAEEEEEEEELFYLSKPLTLIRFRKSITAVRFGQDQRSLLVSKLGGILELWDCLTRKRMQRFEGHKHEKLFLRASLFCSQQPLIASGSEDARISIWRLHQVNQSTCKSCTVPRHCTLDGHRAAVNAVAWHPQDARILLSASDDGTIRLWWATRE